MQNEREREQSVNGIINPQIDLIFTQLNFQYHPHFLGASLSAKFTSHKVSPYRLGLLLLLLTTKRQSFAEIHKSSINKYYSMCSTYGDPGRIYMMIFIYTRDTLSCRRRNLELVFVLRASTHENEKLTLQSPSARCVFGLLKTNKFSAYTCAGSHSSLCCSSLLFSPLSHRFWLSIVWRSESPSLSHLTLAA